MKGVIIIILFCIFIISFVNASVMVNEFVVSPQTDWNGDGNIRQGSDEWIELYNNGTSSINITGWNLSLIDSTNATQNLFGIIPPNNYFTILDPSDQQSINGQIILYSDSGVLVDSVTYGNYPDGNISDNAPSGSASSINDECLARIPNGVDSDINGNDFVKTRCTFNNTNNIVIIQNKTNITCAFESKNVSISADINGSYIDSIWFSYTINGSNYNKTGSLVLGSFNKYFYEIDFSELVNGNITWNVYVNDSFGNVFSNGNKTFYVRNITKLVVNPVTPNGLNSWYISEPLFSLIKDFNGSNIYYQWDSTGALLYSAPFGLENIPNAPLINSSGILELNYWSEFSCGNETKQNQTFYIDLTSPIITNLVPENNSIVYNNPRPLISAYLDEVYQSNSGINKNRVEMKIDGYLVNPSVIDADSLDAIVNFIPSYDLSNGEHNVSIYAEDNAGRNSSLTWFFYINTSAEDFNLNVNSPFNGSFGNRRVRFNITTSHIVEKIEYINYNDKRPKWRRLCRNCDEYGSRRTKTKTLRKGWNNISIKAINRFGNTKIVNISLFIDSRKPKISRILPKRNKVVNGSDFYVKFVESNLKDVLVSWNPVQGLNISEDCISTRRRTECFIDLNLIAFDGQYINFWFNVSDSIRSVKSKEHRVLVDTSAPVLSVNMPENKTYFSRRIPFSINVSEKVLLEYIDNSVSKPRWRRLCNGCNEYGNTKKKTKGFKIGTHHILIRAVDKAGNSDLREVRFEVEY